MYAKTLFRLMAISWIAASWAAYGFSAELAESDWPQWRGPARNGQVTGADWPRKLDEQRLQRTWTVDLGPSYSGPIVAGDRVFTTETRDRKNEVVRALDRKTGNEIWKAEWLGAMRVPFFAASNGSWIRATPAFDGRNLYVAGMRDVLVCLDGESGEERWRLDFVKEFKTPVPAFGFVSSPLVLGGHVYVQAGASFLKIEKETGKIVWRSAKDKGGMYGSAFSSPIAAEIAGTRQLIVQTRQQLKGIEPQSGDELWSRDIKAFRGMNILTPTIYNDSIFTSAHSGKAELLHISSSEAGAYEVESAWTHVAQGYMSTPVVVDGHAYLHMRNQRLGCIDLATGKERWRTKPFGKYWSMVAKKDLILALDQRGDFILFRANPEEFELLDKRHISDDSTWAHLAVSGDELFVRSLKSLTAYRWK